jgi:hypothetical protein
LLFGSCFSAVAFRQFLFGGCFDVAFRQLLRSSASQEGNKPPTDGQLISSSRTDKTNFKPGKQTNFEQQTGAANFKRQAGQLIL